MTVEKKKETIRELTAEEIPRLSSCLESLAAYHNSLPTPFSGSYPVVPVEVHLRDMREHVLAGTAVILGLFLPDGSLGGFGMASNEGKYGEIDYLYVREKLRGRGRGDRLLKMLLDFLAERGVTFVDTNVVKGNPAARLYRKHGFATRTVNLSRRM